MKKERNPRIITPVGILSFPYLYEPDIGREYSDNRFKTDLLIPKSEWDLKGGKTIENTVLSVAKKHFGKDKLTLDDFPNPIKDTDGAEKLTDERMKGCMLIRAKKGADKDGNFIRPHIFDASKNDLTDKEIGDIRGGDYARLVIDVFYYPQKGGGVSFALVAVQYIKKGKPLGNSKQKLLDMLDDIEVPIDDVDLETMGV